MAFQLCIICNWRVNVNNDSINGVVHTAAYNTGKMLQNTISIWAAGSKNISVRQSQLKSVILENKTKQSWQGFDTET